MIVIDTSVAVKWTVKEDGHEAALALLYLDQPLIAPDLLLPELAYVLRKKALKGEIAREQTESGMLGVRKAIEQYVPSSQTVDDALALSEELDHSPYDCFFLACAVGRGVLSTADRVFASKCERAGYGSFIRLLDDVESSRTSISDVISTLDGKSVQAIVRLASRVESTFEALPNAATATKVERFAFSDFGDYVPVFASPAYVALSKVLEEMTADDLSIVLALGWLGRSYQNADEWPSLLSNARTMAADGARKHQAYFMAQMPNVPVGLEKLRASVETQIPS